jgi:hypothetical protein
MSSNYGNSPTTVLDHLRMEFWFLVHPKEYARGGMVQRRGSPLSWAGRSAPAHRVGELCARSRSSVAGLSRTVRPTIMIRANEVIE